MDTRYRSLLSGGPECRGADSRVQVSGEWKIIDPSRLDAKRGVVEFRYADIDAAIETALKQLREESPVANSSSRAGWIRSAAEVLASSGTALVLKAQEETGRVEADLSLELARMQAFLESFIEEPSASPPGDPRGVAAMVLSSVWPLYHALQYSILNLIAGNPVILKPAERVTASVLEFFTLLRKSHPAWERVQVLAGDRELGRRLVCHEAISLVIFQGSFEAGMRVRQDTLSQPAKEVLLFLGAKNPVILLDSGPQSGTEEAILRDAFLGAGQHCLAASQVWVPEKNLEVFVESFHEKSKAFSIGGPGEGAFMGPLLDASITDRYFKFIGISEREGARIVMRGKNHATRTGGYFVTPTLAVFDSISEDQMRRS
ncbi:MAG: aldehyde dehydrogenase, partial [Proteobacteria bacterium]|nr:aldehyde dehydrogenase [Pseudomonadota bacterium]